MKRAATPLEREENTKKCNLLLSISAKRRTCLVSVDGYNWNDFFSRLIFGGFCCPLQDWEDRKKTWRGLHALWSFAHPGHMGPTVCWCTIPKTTDFADKTIQKFYFPQEFRCKKLWKTTVLFRNDNKAHRIRSQLFYDMDGNQWIDYSAPMEHLYDYWKPIPLDAANAITSTNFLKTVVQNERFFIETD